MTRAKEMRDLPLAIDADSNGNLTISGPTTIANDASYYADTLAAVNSSSMALNISPTRASVTKAITLGAMGTTNAGTGIQAYDTSDNSANPFYINPFGGKVGIGSTYGPPYPLTVVGSNVSAGGGLATLGVIDNGTAYNATPGGGITFRGNFHSSGSSAFIGDFGVIRGIKENATSGDFASALIFHTRENGGSLTERFRISSNGNVGIGVNSPTAGFRTSIKGDYSSVVGGIEFDSGGGDKFTVGHATATSPSAKLNVVGAGHLIMATDNTERVRIAHTTGNVGIGTTDPSYAKLHILNDSSAGNDNFILMLQNTTTVADSRAGIMFSTNSGQGAGRDGSAIQASNNGVDGRAHLTFGNVLNNTYDEKVRFTTDGNVGIGTTSPANPLDVLGADSGIIVRSAVANRPHIKLINGTSTMLALSANGSLAYIGDGNSLNRYMSFAGGNVNILGNLYYGGQLYVGGGYYIVASSDDVLKVRTGNIPDALNKISQINGFYYTDSDQVTDLIKGVDEENNQTYHEKTTEQKIGVSAQELQKVLPEVVEDMDTKMSKTQTVYKGVNYGKIVPLLIEGIKELKTTVETLEARIKTLES